MNRKTIAALIIPFILLGALLAPLSAANAQSSVEDSITLQEPAVTLGDGWTLDTTFSSETPYALAFGNGEYVAVGPYGTVMKSTDGQSWKALSKFQNYQLTSIEWDGSKYVMFGANAAYENDASYKPAEAFISKDALTWTKIGFKPGEPIQQLIWGNNEFVALGTSKVFTSKDGENWTTAVTLQKNGYFALGFAHDTYFLTSYDDNTVRISKDGLKWTSKKYDTAAGVQYRIWANNQYIGVGNGIYTSADGVTWKKQSKSPAGATLTFIVHNGSTFIATGYTDMVEGAARQVAYTSTDGVNWKKHDLANLQANIYILYPVKGGFAGIGSNDRQDSPDGTYSIFTKDGSSWSYRLAGTSYGTEFGGIATNGKRTVAVGLNGMVIYTDDGITWKGSNPFPYQERLGRTHLFDVVWGAGKFVAAANGGIYTSANGVSWKKEKVPFRDQYGGLRNIVWTGKFFVASSQVDGVYTSKDAVNWTKVESVSKDTYWLTSSVWDGKRLLGAVRVHDFSDGVGSTKIMQTTNGTTWSTVQTIEIDQALIAWNGKQYIAVDQYRANEVYVSKDGMKWTKSKTNLGENDNFEFITSFDGYFVALNDSMKEINGEYVNYDAYYVSQDGIAWREVRIPQADLAVSGSKIMKDGVKAYGKYIFVGYNGLIMRASELQFQDPIRILINGEELKLSSELGKPYIADGTSYVPLKAIGEALGYEVTWNTDKKEVTLERDGELTYFSNGVVLKNGRSYVKLRALTEFLGYTVDFVKANGVSTITIDK
ncbi:hypothetical protein D3P08_06785 [Paenibacillus nanensis]|uniref:Copper amine oxidase-like N-terminal domain-containing protein n=1 Tax=Paenibacillus nanensis TaxID=393251 RepID=A0A3A1V3J9_9BACL|nr:copper amine oxidase N-terminal domain-containing protein [Paenibacillus nanensis]RIX53952.1 hypothetical protein D3P08_06785 [Paenibacillus nanensis]